VNIITRETRLDDLPELLKADEASAWLGISRNSAYAAIQAGSLPSVRIGRLVRVPRAGLAKLIGGAAVGRA
jgi:excisionase family DNA binding protein